MTDIPHFSVPFRFAHGHASVVEQDSVDEIASCVFTVMACPKGFRSELPEFGIPDPVFKTQPLDLDELTAAIELWEPRAETLLSEAATADELVAQIDVLVNVRTEE